MPKVKKGKYIMSHLLVNKISNRTKFPIATDYRSI